MVDGSIHVAGIGDVDGDGTGDFAAGFEPSSAQDVGEVRVFLGPLSAMGAPTILRVSAGLGVGRRLSGAGDVNGDGYADLLVSAPFATDTLGHAGAGAAFLYLGGPSGILTSPARRYEGGKNDMGFGLAAAGLGDTNGDGYDDVAVGGTVRAGLATVFGGGEAETTHTLALPVITGPLGWAVAGTGDLNGDGLADVAWCDAAFRAVVIYTGIHQPRPPVPETIRLNPPMAAVGPVLAGLR